MLKRQHLLFAILGGFFITNALMAEFIGVKIFSLEETLGFLPAQIRLFGSAYDFNLTAGVLLWPVVFIMTDIINEYYGKKGVKLLSYLTAGLIIYTFLMVSISIGLEPAGFWLDIHRDINPDIDVAFGRIFGQGSWIIIGSVTAFLVGQMLDVLVFHRLRRWTGEKRLWLRATGSTLVSQLIDSFLVLFIAFYIGPPAAQKWPLDVLFAVCIVNYMYKAFMAVALTPLLYPIHWAIDKYLGKKVSEKMITAAAAAA